LTHGTSRQTPFQSLSNRHNNVGSHAKPHSVTITRRSGLYTAWVKTLVHVVAYAYTALFLIPLGGVLVFLAAHRGPETLDAPAGRPRGRPALAGPTLEPPCAMLKPGIAHTPVARRAIRGSSPLKRQIAHSQCRVGAIQNFKIRSGGV
jgi:hypothetical protein